MKINFYLKFIIFLIFCCSVHAATHDIQASNYLLKPTGIYGVGYQDIFLVNTDICPDTFYVKNVNEDDFCHTNKQYCHEIALRVYYPSKKALNPGDEYYTPYLTSQINWFANKKNLSEKDIGKLNTILKIETYTFANTKPVNTKKFPIIVFMPGAGTPAQGYNNIISDLVSNGYIVVGVNSLFINGALQVENGNIVLPPDTYIDEDRRSENISDLKFVLEHLAEIDYKYSLQEQMDFNTIGLIGHSMGAMSIVNTLKADEIQTYKNIKAIILMDPGDLLKRANYPLPKFSIPTMTIWSSSFKSGMHGNVLLGNNNYEVILKPHNENDEFSQHNNFTDSSTMQYHPAYIVGTINKEIGVGYGNGYEIATNLNNYALKFLNHYLRSTVINQPLRLKDFKDDYIINLSCN